MLNRDGRPFLDGCLGAVLAQELHGEVEVLLVDNGSTDGSADHVRQRWPEVRLLEAGRNLGFTGGNNLGLREARGRHLVLLNNDTRPRPGWLAALVAAAESEPKVGAVTSKLVYADRPRVIQNAGSVLLNDGGGADRGGGEEDRGQYDAREEVFGFCGAAVLLTRPMLRDVGVFDDALFAYYEDTDLSWRLRLRGWRVLYEPAAIVEHIHSGTSVEWSEFFTYHVDRNRLLVLLKNAPWGFAAGAAGRLARRAAASGEARARHARVSRMRVIAAVLYRLPATLAKRWRVRRRRLVSDREVLAWIKDREEWDSRSV